MNSEAFADLLKNSVEIPIDGKNQRIIEEISEQVSTSAELIVQVCVFFGKTKEYASVETRKALEEYMQDPERAEYADTLFKGLPWLVSQLWDMYIDSL